jgi:hypothetical protein
LHDGANPHHALIIGACAQHPGGPLAAAARGRGQHQVELVETLPLHHALQQQEEKKQEEEEEEEEEEHLVNIAKCQAASGAAKVSCRG